MWDIHLTDLGMLRIIDIDEKYRVQLIDLQNILKPIIYIVIKNVYTYYK